MLWIKSLHIVFVVTWFAAAFYLPRLFVYHVDALAESDALGNARFKIMERKLLRGILFPSAIAATIFGTWLWVGYGFRGGWLHAKLAFVVVLWFHAILCLRYQQAFAVDANQKSRKFFIWFNELPALSLFGGVMLVVMKPF